MPPAHNRRRTPNRRPGGPRKTGRPQDLVRRTAFDVIRAGKNEVLVGTGTHPVALGEVQPQGKRRMPATDWIRGVTLTGKDALH